MSKTDDGRWYKMTDPRSETIFVWVSFKGMVLDRNGKELGDMYTMDNKGYVFVPVSGNPFLEEGKPSVKSLRELREKIHSNINHPPHYNQSPSGIECIQVVRHMEFNLGNAIKYIWRAGKKEGRSDIEDLKKAIWYLEDEIALREERDANG